MDTIVLHKGHNDAEQFCLSKKDSRKWESDDRIWEQIHFIALNQLHHANNVYFSEQKFNASEFQVLQHISENGQLNHIKLTCHDDSNILSDIKKHFIQEFPVY